MSGKLGWGILAAGSIAKAFAKGVAHSKTGRLVAVGSRSQEKADKLGAEFDIPKRYGSYAALLADPEVQAVYIATPHPMHAEWAIKAAEAKKHVLCEKPIGLNAAEAMMIVEAARANDVFLMEAYMYRCHPQTAKLVELIKSKAIGEVKLIQAAFSFHWPRPFKPDTRLTDRALGGGGILDVGGYPISLARVVAGAAMGEPFADPIDLKALGHLESTGIDGYTVAVLRFPGDILAQVSTGVQLNQDNSVRIFGTDGSIVISDAWIPAKEGGTVKIEVRVNGKPAREEIVETGDWLYGIEADTVAQNIEKRQAASPAMSWADTIGNMQALDAWRSQIGVVYDSEKLVNLKRPDWRAAVKVSPKNNMKYGKIPGIDKPVSRCAVGGDFAGGAQAAAMAIFDDAFERGVTLYDSAIIYGGGKSDTVVGHWMNSRGVREQCIFLGKGGHTPNCNPTAIRRELARSLELAKLDYIDLYILHRDNPEIPVGEFVDLLNEFKKAGKIRAFGGSNWSLARVQEANDYAKAKGLTPLAVVSNNFSLARMLDPIWDGCIASSDVESRAWFAKSQMAQVPWSSQARGFFTERAHRDKSLNDPELNRVWYSDDNWKRRDRVMEMAKKKNVLPINIALAYVLCQPSPMFPLIGPRQIEETRTSLAALDVALTPEDLKWLNLEA